MNCRGCGRPAGEHCYGCNACPGQECPDWCEGPLDLDDDDDMAALAVPAYAVGGRAWSNEPR